MSEPFKSATIPDTSDTMGSIHMPQQHKLAMIYPDANFDGSVCTVEVNVGPIGSPVWKALEDDDQAAVTLTLTADTPMVIDTNAGKVAQLRSFRLVSDTSQTSGDCEIRFWFK